MLDHSNMEHGGGGAAGVRVTRIGRTPGEVMTKGYIPAAQLYDNPEQNMTLIKSVEKRPGIYNMGSGGLGKEKREEAKRLWDEIAAEINLPADECKSRWGHLRSDFRGKVKAYQATGRIHHKEWIYYSALEFLIPYIKAHKNPSLPYVDTALSTRVHKMQFSNPVYPQDGGYAHYGGTPPTRPRHSQEQAHDYSNTPVTVSELSPHNLAAAAAATPASCSRKTSADNVSRDSLLSEHESDSIFIMSSDESDREIGRQAYHPENLTTKHRRKRDRPLKVVLGSKHARRLTEEDGSPPSPPMLTKAPNAAAAGDAAVVNQRVPPQHTMLVKQHEITVNTPMTSPPIIPSRENPPAYRAARHHQVITAQSHQELHSNHMIMVPAGVVPIVAQHPAHPVPSEHDEEPRLLVTITDTSNIHRMFCQKISYHEAAELNLRGFYIHHWDEEERRRQHGIHQQQQNGVGASNAPPSSRTSAASAHPGEHYTVSNGYLPPPAHMFGQAYQSSHNSTAGRGRRPNTSSRESAGVVRSSNNVHDSRTEY